jgi:acetamidase/formamidase
MYREWQHKRRLILNIKWKDSNLYQAILATGLGVLISQGGYASDPASTAKSDTSNTAACFPYQSKLPNQTLMLAPSITKHPKAKTYILPAIPATTQWGSYNSEQKPVLTIKSGDSVSIETMAASDNQVVPGLNVEEVAKMNSAVPGRGPHTITGPIYVEGAEPGDILKIHFNKIVPRAYASNNNIPGKGLFPEDFPVGQIKYFSLDLKTMTTTFAPGIVVPLAPFPGVIAVARAEPGKYDTIPPGRFGGNLDIREMTEGTTLYLPVFVKGALLWTGDSHAGQGNGEINLTAIETAFSEFNLTVDVIKQKPLTWPRIETPKSWITVGYDSDLNKALDILKQETIKFISEYRHMSPSEAEKVMLKTWNCPIGEVVNEIDGVYCIIPKDETAPLPAPLPKTDDATRYVTYGKDADLKKAMKIASMAMINKIAKEKKMTRLDVYSLLSIAMDCRMAPHQSGDKEVHCILDKSLWVS